jgi:hypothetical protein
MLRGLFFLISFIDASALASTGTFYRFWTGLRGTIGKHSMTVRCGRRRLRFRHVSQQSLVSSHQKPSLGYVCILFGQNTFGDQEHRAPEEPRPGPPFQPLAGQVFLVIRFRENGQRTLEPPRFCRSYLRCQSASMFVLLADSQASSIEQLCGIRQTAIPDCIATAEYPPSSETSRLSFDNYPH